MTTAESTEAIQRQKKVSTLLITQASPPEPNNAYAELAKKYGVKIDFRPFIVIERVPLKEFRKQKISILEHTAIIFTSRHAIDHFFGICAELKIEMPAEMKYFCVTEQTANYLQKYIVIRKRKIFSGGKTAADLCEVLKKHKTENYLFPCSNIRTPEIPEFLARNNIAYKETVMYQTVSADLSDLANVNYDVIAFFSPSGLESLKANFPDFKQNNTRLAAFGPTTAKAVTEAGLILDIVAPAPNAPSMTGALENYIKKANNVK